MAMLDKDGDSLFREVFIQLELHQATASFSGNGTNLAREFGGISERGVHIFSLQGNRIFKSPFSSKTKIRLNLPGVKHAQSRSGNGVLLRYSSA